MRLQTTLSHRWIVTRVTQPLALLAFALGVWLAYRHFPGEFDWRYVVISALQSPEDNPEGYHWLALGMGFSGLMLLPLALHLSRALHPFTAKGAKVVRQLLILGALGTVAVALFTHRPDVYPRLHEHLAFVAYLASVSGLLATTWLLARHPSATLLGSARHWAISLLALLIIAPIVAAGATQLVLYFTSLSDLGWVDITWRSRGIPPYLSFAFWQWLLSILLYLSGWLLAWLAISPRDTCLSPASASDAVTCRGH